MYEVYNEEVEHKDEKHALVSIMFSGSLTGVILSLELSHASHRGLKQVIGLLFKPDDEGKEKLNWPVAIIAVVKVGITIFCATLYTWTNDPDTLAVMGLVILFILSVTRILNRIFEYDDDETEEVQNTAALLSSVVA